MSRQRIRAFVFLKSHGWAIILAIIAIVVLGYLGILNLRSYLPETCTIAPTLTCEVSKLLSDGIAVLTIKNEGDATINNINIKIGNVEGECKPNENIAARDETTCTINVATGATGNRFSDTITFVYTEEGNTLIHKQIGEILAIYGEPELPF
ncbi:MAG: hypothetical protein V1914_02110 [archaeon]